MKRVVLLAALLSFSAWGQSEGNASKRLQRLEEQMAEQADPLTETEANALYQAKDVDLSLWAGLTPAAFFQTLVDDADAAAVRSTIGALASASYTAADVLSKLLTVDGSSSGVDADLLDGSSSAAFLAAASYTAADVLSKMLTVDGSSSLLDADLLDGSSSAAFAASSHTHAQGDVTNLVSDLAAKLASSSYTASDVSTKLQTVDGSGSGIDADLLDGISSAALAALASPTFTGNPLGPTASANDSDTSLATTAFVQQEIDDADNLSDNCAVEADSTPVPYACVGTGADPYTNTLGSDGDKGVVDEGVFEVWAHFRTVGASTSAVLQCLGRLTHRLSITGFGTGVSEPEIATSGGFDSTTASLQIGASVNGGTSASWTVSLVQATLENLAP